ncbi:hypothetical protein [Allorhodopirellula heiligendammensis]|uniref:Uncharacterized protein n=1 Tax=Allorhodopirellula heiligendammensis TaxID=2714739 RepID=A0A5C6BZL7_9BACT|nr:hypothetical protein [Allorhodopirellula heiligendammensis]TWU16059.1 hypothetical protein Poly21_32640 [Allorhodopirellula heiligendammensis]
MPQTVQCPQCQTAVDVRKAAGGNRIDCPYCGQSFIVPGVGDAPSGTSAGALGASTSSNLDDDDDDWLNLGDLPPVPPVTPNFAGVPGEVSQPDDPDPLADFPAAADTWDEDRLPTEKEDDLGSTFDERPAGTNSDGQKIEYQTEYRVRCPTCGTQNDVTAKQAGKQIRCRDCFTMVRVPKPPRVARKVQIDMTEAPAFQFTPLKDAADRPADPFRKSANEYLEAASKTEKAEPKPDLDVPRIRDWARAVFGIFTQIGVVAHWLILSAIASVVAFFVLSIDSDMLVVGLYAAGAFFGAIVLACGFTIMQSIANEEESVDDWPITLEPMEWLAPTVFCFAAAGLAYGPGFFIGYMTFGPSLTTVCMAMISTFLIFPFVLLSMLDMQTVFMPFSPDVGRSVTRCEEAWGGFYFSSGVVFFFTFLIFAFASLFPAPLAAVIGIFVGVAAEFIYFAMLGRLAHAIGQSVNADAKVNNIDQERQRERDRQSK